MKDVTTSNELVLLLKKFDGNVQRMDGLSNTNGYTEGVKFLPYFCPTIRYLWA